MCFNYLLHPFHQKTIKRITHIGYSLYLFNHSDWLLLVQINGIVGSYSIGIYASKVFTTQYNRTASLVSNELNKF